ncbi:MAG: MBL fold metallo-hydrolase [Saprospiraceae bacterium]|uniref:MBL fold metallo-hydrolase n=1 Tax=Candidatus Defluviibacterium haderslevense TaxID=2981993 RepID=A0A9D7XC93_9BACT|nr:MBL fold metallo-hydrolase [Candidatus Defluviibacterium haderslevense]
MEIHCFTVNPFSENSYLIWSESKKAIVIDPGFYTQAEQYAFKEFILENGLQLEKVVLTHAHIDHIFGLEFIFKEFGLQPWMNLYEKPVYLAGGQISQMYGMNVFNYPEPGGWIDEQLEYPLADLNFEVLFTPGHSPGSISFYNKEHGVLFSGDVLFEGSIGRTDLPGGDHKTLISSIQKKLLILPHSTKVYSGHGGITTIGQEKMCNPFL